MIKDLFFHLQIYLLAEYVDFFAFGITALIAGELIIKKINQGSDVLHIRNTLFWYEGIHQTKLSVHNAECFRYSFRTSGRSLARLVGHSPVSSPYYEIYS